MATAALDSKITIQPSCYLTDQEWSKLEPHIPPHPPRNPKGGRPPQEHRRIANAIFFILRTGAQWNSITVQSFGVSKSTAHLYFQRWVQAGVFKNFWVAGLLEYDARQGIEWNFQSLDGSMVKAPFFGGI